MALNTYEVGVCERSVVWLVGATLPCIEAIRVWVAALQTLWHCGVCNGDQGSGGSCFLWSQHPSCSTEAKDSLLVAQRPFQILIHPCFGSSKDLLSVVVVSLRHPPPGPREAIWLDQMDEGENGGLKIILVGVGCRSEDQMDIRSKLIILHTCSLTMDPVQTKKGILGYK